MRRSIVLPALIASLSPAYVFAGDSAVVLMYHRFGEDRYPSTNITVEQFEAHIDYIADNDFNVISLADFLQAREAGTALPDRAVVITIDDAYRSVYDVAFPRFRERGYPFVVFVASDAVDEGLPAYMSWEQMREMQSAGGSFANHGAGHRSVLEREDGASDDEWLASVRADVEKGWMRLTEELEPVPGAFAYPYGDFDTRTGNLLSEMGYVSFGQNSGAVGRMSDDRGLPRYPMAESYGDMGQFRTKVRSIDLPVSSVEPWEPITTERLPSVTITLDGDVERLGELACYVGGQGKVDVDWETPGSVFVVGPKTAFSKGRQRVNCTVPSNSGRYRWFSHQWFIVDQE